MIVTLTFQIEGLSGVHHCLCLIMAHTMPTNLVTFKLKLSIVHYSAAIPLVVANSG